MRSACRAEFHQNACTCCAEIRNVTIYTYRLGNRRMQRSHRDLPCCNRVFSVHVAPQKTLRCSLSAYDGHLAEHRRLHLSGEAIHILGRLLTLMTITRADQNAMTTLNCLSVRKDLRAHPARLVLSLNIILSDVLKHVMAFGWLVMPRDMRSGDLHGSVLDGSAVRVPLLLELSAILHVSIRMHRPSYAIPVSICTKLDVVAVCNLLRRLDESKLPCGVSLYCGGANIRK